MKIDDIGDFFREKKEKLKDLGESEYLRRLYIWRDKINKEIDSRANALRSGGSLIKKAISEKIQLRVYKRNFFQYFRIIRLRHVVGAPFIYGMIIPAFILHICVELFHQVSFRLYGIPRVDSDRYFVIDRIHLSYLNWFEKFNCVYCGYFNGLMGYAREIAGRTEKYWCPIKHARRLHNTHSHYGDFFEYLDGKGYREGLKDKRKEYPEL